MEKQDIYICFVQGPSECEVKELFEGVDLSRVKVTIRHDHSMVLLALIGYLGRAYAKYSITKEYLEILKEV